MGISRCFSLTRVGRCVYERGMVVMEWVDDVSEGMYRPRRRDHTGGA